VKAAVCHAFDAPLQIEQIRIDPPQQYEVQVKLKACGVCHSDIHSIDGSWGGTLPAVYGHEAAGVVESVGPGVSSLAPGDRVIATLLRACGECYYCTHDSSYLCDSTLPIDGENRLHGTDDTAVVQGLRTGAFAEFVVIHQSQVAVIPADMPFESAALLGCGVLTGWGAVVNTAGMPAGSSAAVFGIGGVGVNTLQAAALCGSDPLIAIDPATDKHAMAERLGATCCLEPAASDLPAQARALTGGRGVDYAFVTVGRSAMIAAGLQILRPGGTLVLVGMPAAGDILPLETGDIAHHGQRILGSKMGSASMERDIPRLIELYQSGDFRLDELVSGRYPLEQINEAISSVKRSAALRNVIVF
jgi:Zn-dependent alcohol dehydrogenase